MNLKPPPPLTIGLPVYNGANYLRESLDALLAQTYGDYELIISDNASTDTTADICRMYAAKDERIRYIRQPTNIGASPNHNVLVHEARAKLFKWASHDDLYAPDLIRRCVDALETDRELVLAHSWQAIIDESGTSVFPVAYNLNTDDPRAPERFKSLLFTVGGDDFYGVIRRDVLLRTGLLDSYHHADRTIMGSLALHGRFHQVPEQLFFRRDHQDRSERANPSMRERCANLDPRRANRWRHPVPRLAAEYVWGFVSAIRQAPLSPADRRECYRHLASWMASRAKPGTSQRMEDTTGA